MKAYIVLILLYYFFGKTSAILGVFAEARSEQEKPPIRVQARMGGIFSETLWTMPLSISCCRQAYDFDAQAPENRWARPPNAATGRKTVASAFHGANRISGEMSAGKMGRIGFRDPAQLGHVRSEA